jgi:protein-tyrosine phosphatase
MTTGRIDVHSHLIPGVDDGCRDLAESIACAKLLVEAGYTHSFCTPHVLPEFPGNTVANITRKTRELQAALAAAGVPLKLTPGGEITIRERTSATAADALVSFGMARKFVLVDMWVDRLPPYFRPTVEWLQGHGVRVILAHPERMEAVQREPELVDYFQELGLLLQGNLQCFSDAPNEPRRRLAERFLLEGRYLLLGSDLHNLASLPTRLQGLRRAIQLAGDETVHRLTVEHPQRLLPV